MTKRWLISAILLSTVATVSWAADDSTPASSTSAKPSATAAHHQWTLEEARKHAHDWADKLDKMTPEEWAAQEKARQAKWKSMTPDQKAALKTLHSHDDAPAATPAATK